MDKRVFRAGGEHVSLLGFGGVRLPLLREDSQEIDKKKGRMLVDYAMANGVNYYDTAYTYHDRLSEPFFGEAMKRYPRESFYFATKLPIWEIKTESDVEKIFFEQLQACQMEYFDFYLAHNLNKPYYEIFKKYHIYDTFKRLQQKGYIRYLGFSFHDEARVLEPIVSEYDWDFAQIQLNYVDWELQNAKLQYEILEKHNLPVVVMEPLRGGTLAALNDEAQAILKQANPDVSAACWGLRYVASLPNVLTILSGMNELFQIEDNIKTLTDVKPLTDDERIVLDQAYQAYRKSGTIPCTGCRYCMDCPSGVDIPKNFLLYNEFCLNKNPYQLDYAYQAIGESRQAKQCISCNQCVERCPQFINIPDWLHIIAERAKECAI